MILSVPIFSVFLTPFFGIFSGFACATISGILSLSFFLKNISEVDDKVDKKEPPFLKKLVVFSVGSIGGFLLYWAFIISFMVFSTL